MPWFSIQVRAEADLTRRDVYDAVQISDSYLRQIEEGRRPNPSPDLIEQLIKAYRLTTAQARHLRDLAAPPVDLPSTDDLRNCLLSDPAHLDHLEDLERRGVLGAYIDPLFNVLAMNDLMSAALPGLEQVGNVVEWWLLPIAQEVIIDFPAETDYLVAAVKGAMGRYRGARQTVDLIRSLRKHRLVNRLWTSRARIAFGRPTTDAIRWRNPATGDLFAATVHIQRVSDSAQTLLLTIFPKPDNANFEVTSPPAQPQTAPTDTDHTAEPRL
ncbi:helix-turn-helix domain-containing protein [Nocardia blacklockiae]|uniref:helix-turn-helix domain-containing protein n=1 Tax=Nocardia blacklockiae TaxID=480036 RepID=UPI001893B1C5|nr:helix-turn-helix domain-containing protein [Nocardia blacklockiae]MBF6176062.1 helix-turn-helix domain-containing protein [Nocardia blacklockiae]